MARAMLSIIGMHCSSCALDIERALERMRGVKSANINYSISRGSVEYDEGTIDEQRILRAVEALGYRAAIYRRGSDVEKLAREKELAFYRYMTIIGAVFSLPVFAITMLRLQIPYAPYVMWLFATPVQFYVGRHFYKGLFAALKARTINTDTLIAVGTTVAYFYSVYLVLFEGGAGTYFATSSMLITFMIIGRYLEAIARGEASQSIRKLFDLTPKKAVMLKGRKESEIYVRDVKAGDMLVIRKGERVPADGIVLQGQSNVDESMITGEPIPAEKTKGSLVIGGTLNKNGTIVIRATKVGSDSMLSQIIRLVEEAQAQKAPIQRFTDRMASIFVPMVILMAAMTFVTWYFLLDRTLSFSLVLGVSVLVIACPCALGLAAPAAIMVGTGKGASNGILIRNGEVVEKAAKIDAIAFDKTGTITVGKPELVDFKVFQSLVPALDIAYSMEKVSGHLLAEPFSRYVEEKGARTLKVDQLSSIPGKGIVGKVSGKVYALGNMNLMDARKVEVPRDVLEWKREKEEMGNTVVLLSAAGKVGAAFAISDRIRKDAVATIASLKSAGLKTYMVTGDSKRAAAAIAKQTGIDNYFAEVLPEGKARFVKRLRERGLTVAMVGDGINDAPALAVSDLGIAMGSGTDVAIETGDIILIKNRLKDVEKAIRLSRLTMNKIKENLFWALIYNVIGMPVAAGLLFPFFGITLSPMIAVGAMALSSISVVTNSLLLNMAKIEEPKKEGYDAAFRRFLQTGNH